MTKHTKMNNIIIGNGINIQFGGLEYTNENIIKRALLNLKTNNFSKEVYTKEIETWINILYSAIPDFLNGNYDQLAVLNDEKKELENFKKRYSTSSKVSDIGFEDYFLLNELHCRKNNIKNPERYDFQEFLRRVFLDSIYNGGKINEIHKKFPKAVVEYIKSFDNVFTTNFDKNIEIALNKKVLYLHGAFHVLDPVYDPESFRNQLSDRPVDKTPVIKGYEHIFSTALTGYSGAFKQYAGNEAELANSAIEKFAERTKSNPEISKQIEEWENSDNEIVRNLYEAIKLKQKDPSLKISTDYSINKLKDIKGKMTIIGLSPNNDSHILKIVKENIKIDTIEFYSYDEKDSIIINLFFNNKKVIIESIKEFWKNNTSI